MDIVQSIVTCAFLTISMDLNRNISFFTPPLEQAPCGSTCQGPLDPRNIFEGLVQVSGMAQTELLIDFKKPTTLITLFYNTPSLPNCIKYFPTVTGGIVEARRLRMRNQSKHFSSQAGNCSRWWCLQCQNDDSTYTYITYNLKHQVVQYLFLRQF